jgi:hypothetical protein
MAFIYTYAKAYMLCFKATLCGKESGAEVRSVSLLRNLRRAEYGGIFPAASASGIYP